eukprot:CAMPEP_0170560808 /NCGR_PEP_ID=MMETSP0211-20121228/51143_1 /TAXON_ID=311385 /ORGANISM="Pseudokeronopsis sp., Strain OXSARD2" /LENGTH=114 /DNA_ID=CAMNT_0010875527 /DNA_START=149 /DNA_END=493 /DNA_ORIENTATION=+
MVLLGFLLLIFMMTGFILFSYLEEFESFINVFQTLMSVSFGNFKFSIFDGGEAELVGAYNAPTFGKFYLILLIILSNIMMLNLMIAVFSDTYNKLQLVAEGVFLAEIIEMSPEK